MFNMFSKAEQYFFSDGGFPDGISASSRDMVMNMVN